jgi:hypothetical protein
MSPRRDRRHSGVLGGRETRMVSWAERIQGPTATTTRCWASVSRLYVTTSAATTPSPETVFASSQASLPTTTPSPQTTVDWHTCRGGARGGLGTAHTQFSSNAHLASQQSPAIVLPSSHCSPVSTVPLPHVLVGKQALPGVAHVQPFSSPQLQEQPSPLAWLWSSQASPDSTRPLPQ